MRQTRITIDNEAYYHCMSWALGSALDGVLPKSLAS